MSLLFFGVEFLGRLVFIHMEHNGEHKIIRAAYNKGHFLDRTLTNENYVLIGDCFHCLVPRDDPKGNKWADNPNLREMS